MFINKLIQKWITDVSPVLTAEDDLDDIDIITTKDIKRMKFEEAKPRPLPTASTKGVLDDGPPPTTPTRKGWNGRVYSRVPPGAMLPKENHSDSDATGRCLRSKQPRQQKVEV